MRSWWIETMDKLFHENIPKTSQLIINSGLCFLYHHQRLRKLHELSVFMNYSLFRALGEIRKIWNCEELQATRFNRAQSKRLSRRLGMSSCSTAAFPTNAIWTNECSPLGIACELNIFNFFFNFSFIEEFTSSQDGVSLLLEVLRAIQLSQNTIAGSSTPSLLNLEMRNNQPYQRRALLDELTCL